MPFPFSFLQGNLCWQRELHIVIAFSSLAPSLFLLSRIVLLCLSILLFSRMVSDLFVVNILSFSPCLILTFLTFPSSRYGDFWVLLSVFTGNWGSFTSQKNAICSAEMPLEVNLSPSWSFEVLGFDHFPLFILFQPPALKPLPVTAVPTALSSGFWPLLRSLWVTWSYLYILMPQSFDFWYRWIPLASSVLLGKKRNSAIGEYCYSASHLGCCNRRRSKCEDLL